MNKQPKTKPKESVTMTLLEAEQFLRKIDEWNNVVKMERDIIIKWAMFLKDKQENKNK